jgi:ABC-type glycerol-3-phosphate transport system substrate-binding protein
MVVAGCSRNQGPVKGEIVFWHWMTDREDALQELAERYSKEKGVKIRLELYAPSDAYASKVRAAVQTKTLPDIFGVLGESRDLASFINSGHIADLAAAMDAEGGAWRKTFFPKALATTSFEAGNQHSVKPGLYGVPIDVTNMQMLINEEHFEKAGLDPKKPPQTWEDFIAAWRKLKAAGAPGLVSGWGETWLIDCLANNFAMNIMGEKKVFDTFRGRVPYTDPDWIRVLALFDEMRKEELLVSGIVTMNNKTAEQTFANGKASFAFNGSWCVNVYKGMNPDLKFSAMLPPRIVKSNPMRIWGGAGSSLMINAHTPNLEESIQFLKWLTAAEQQSRLSKETMNLPANRTAVGDLPPALASFAAKMDSTTHPSQWPVTENSTVIEAFDKGIQSILIGEKTPAQVASEVQAFKKQQSR